MAVRSEGALTALSSARVAAVPVLMALVLAESDSTRARAGIMALFLAAAATDFVDGYLARRWEMTSTLGSFLDTTADKLLVSGVLIALIAVGHASPWVGAIIVGRELVIMGLRGVVAADGAVMAPSLWGKLKANVQYGAIALAVLRADVEIGPLLLDEWAMLAAAFVTVMSAVEYLSRFSATLGRATPPSP